MKKELSVNGEGGTAHGKESFPYLPPLLVISPTKAKN
jgi:hypothetical protein